MASFDDLRVWDCTCGRPDTCVMSRHTSPTEVASLLAESEEGREAMLKALVEAGC